MTISPHDISNINHLTTAISVLEFPNTSSLSTNNLASADIALTTMTTPCTEDNLKRLRPSANDRASLYRTWWMGDVRVSQALSETLLPFLNARDRAAMCLVCRSFNTFLQDTFIYAPMKGAMALKLERFLLTYKTESIRDAPMTSANLDASSLEENDEKERAILKHRLLKASTIYLERNVGLISLSMENLSCFFQAQSTNHAAPSSRHFVIQDAIRPDQEDCEAIITNDSVHFWCPSGALSSLLLMFKPVLILKPTICTFSLVSQQETKWPDEVEVAKLEDSAFVFDLIQQFKFEAEEQTRLVQLLVNDAASALLGSALHNESIRHLTTDLASFTSWISYPQTKYNGLESLSLTLTGESELHYNNLECWEEYLPWREYIPELQRITIHLHAMPDQPYRREKDLPLQDNSHVLSNDEKRLQPRLLRFLQWLSKSMPGSLLESSPSIVTLSLRTSGTMTNKSEFERLSDYVRRQIDHLTKSGTTPYTWNVESDPQEQKLHLRIL